METIQSLYNLFEGRGFPGHMAPKLQAYHGEAPLVWRFSSAGVTFDRDCRVRVGVYDLSGVPQAGVTVHNVTVAGHVETLVTDASGVANFFMGSGSGYSQPNQGPHTITIAGASDRVIGIGLPNGHHADFGINFQLRRNEQQEDPGNGEDPEGCLLAMWNIFKRAFLGG